MNAEPDPPREAPDSGRPAASDDRITRDSTTTAGQEGRAAPSDAHPDRELFDALREEGWTGTPFVVHGNAVLGNTEMYEAAERLGIADQVPRISLIEVYREAGLDFEEIDSGTGSADPERSFFEDYLRELPRHLRDKYEL